MVPYVVGAVVADPTSSAFMRSVASHPAGPHGRLAQKTLIGPLLLGSQAQHTHSLEDHTWSIQYSTSSNTKQVNNIQQQQPGYVVKVRPDPGMS